MSIKKYANGTLDELGMRILIGEVGYEIVLNAKGYAIEDKHGSSHAGMTFETIKDICKHLEPEFAKKHGSFTVSEMTEEEKHEQKMSDLVVELSGLEKKDRILLSHKLMATVDTSITSIVFFNIFDDSELMLELDNIEGREKMIETSTAIEILSESKIETDMALLETIKTLDNLGIYDIVIGS